MNCYRCNSWPCSCADGITIVHGDARELLPAIEADSVDMIFTDPPYGHNNNNGDLIDRWEAAKKAGRRFIGAEIDERWCERAANRLRQEVLQFTE